MKFKVPSSKFKVLAILTLLSVLPNICRAGVSTNKTFVVETNNVLPSNETDFFEVNLGLLDEAVYPGGVTASEAWAVALLYPPGIYVDSVLGSDTNSGTQASPLQHLYAVTAALGAGSTVATNIFLKRDSKFYESFVAPTNSFVSDYSAGLKPIITGVTNLANALFSLTTGKTNTYQMPLVVPIETNSYPGTTIVQSNVLMVWQANQRMGARWDYNASYNNNTNTAINSVDGNPNSFFYDVTNHVLYINPSTNGSPVANGLVYEASIRTLALVGSSNCTVSNIIAGKAYAFNSAGNQGYSILGQFSGTFIDCVGRRGWNHIMGSAPYLVYVGTNAWINCYGYDVESNITYNVPGVVFVAQAANATNLVTMPACNIFSNCLAVATPGGLASAVSTEFTSGFYMHEATNLNVQIYNCVASNCYYGFDSQTNITILTNCVAVNCFDGVEAIDAASDVVDHFYAYNCTNGVLAQVPLLNLTVNNSQFWQMANAGICGLATTNIYATNNIFAGTNNLTYGILANPGTTPIWSWNNSFWGIYAAYIGGMFTNLSGANTADYNDYYGNTRIAGNMIPSPGYALSFANWQTMWPLADVHGTTGNPTYPSSDFAYTVVSPSGADSNVSVILPEWVQIQNGGGLTNLQSSNIVGAYSSLTTTANGSITASNVTATNINANSQTVNGILKIGGDCQMSDHSGSLAFYDPTSTEFLFGASSLGASDGNIYAGTFNGSAANFTANTMPLAVLDNIAPNTILANSTGSSGAATATGNPNITNLTTTVNGGITTSNAIASNITATAQGYGPSVGFVGNAPGLTNGLPTMIGSSAAPTMGTTTYYFALIGSYATSAGESTVQTYVTRAGTVTNFYVHVTSSVGAGSNIVFTVNHNGSSTGVTCTSTSSANRVNDTTHSFAVAIGDTISVTAVPTGTIGAETYIMTLGIQ
jgi:hypothetical protein